MSYLVFIQRFLLVEYNKLMYEMVIKRYPFKLQTFRHKAHLLVRSDRM